MKSIIYFIVLNLLSHTLFAQSIEYFHLQVQLAHTASDIAIAKNGKFFCTGGTEDGLIKIWETSSGRLLREFKGLDGYADLGVSNLQIGSDNRSISFKFGNKIFDAETGEPMRTMRSGMMSPDGKWILSISEKRDATGTPNYALEVYENGGQPQLAWYNALSLKEADIKKYLISTDSKYVFSLFDNTIHKTDITIGKVIQKFKKKNLPDLENAYGWKLHPDGKYIFWQWGSSIYSLNTETLENVRYSATDYLLVSGKYLPDGSFIVIKEDFLNHNSKVMIYDGHTFEEKEDLTEIFAKSINYADWDIKSFDVSGDGKYLVGIGKGKHSGIYIFDLEKRQLIREIIGIKNNLSNLTIENTGRFFTTSGEQDVSSIWDLNLGRIYRSFQQPGMSSSFINPDGDRLVYLSKDIKKVRRENGYDFVDIDIKMGKIYNTKDGSLISETPYYYYAHPLENGSGYYGVKDDEGSKKNLSSSDFNGRLIKEFVSESANTDQGKTVEYHSSDVRKSRFKNAEFFMHPYVNYYNTISPTGSIGWMYGIYLDSDREEIGTTLRISYDNNAALWSAAGSWFNLRFSNDETKAFEYGATYSGGNPYISVLDSKTGAEIKKVRIISNQINHVFPSKDDSNFLASGTEGIEIYDYSSDKMLKILKGHSGGVNYARYTPDEKRILSLGLDQTIKLWDVASGKNIITFVPAGEHDYATVTPDYYYTASKDVGQYLHFVKGMETFSFDNFDLALNRPDIVLKRLGEASEKQIVAYKAAYLKRLSKLGFTEDQISNERHLPDVSIITKNIPYETEQGSFTFKINAQDEKYNLDRINVYINGVPIYGSKGQSVRDMKTKTLKDEIELELSSGDNSIQVSVHNEKGAESIKESFRIVYSKERPSETYIVSIGISDYRDNNYDLNYAAKDANDIAAKFGTDASKVFKITDTNATKEKILAVKSSL
ncbi:WD40 repeat domain-containing protein, partial [Reichenbachiella sp. MALMAid0571]|uniref:WD40 repeat domain-containing protein n=1 Tax=Reichenbachiella sp. MALMAid0571 TaxID=3143939 RepID=UPI0032DF4488